MAGVQEGPNVAGLSDDTVRPSKNTPECDEFNRGGVCYQEYGGCLDGISVLAYTSSLLQNPFLPQFPPSLSFPCGPFVYGLPISFTV